MTPQQFIISSMYWVIGPISGNSFSTDIRLHYTRSPVRPQNLVIAYQSSAYICSSYLVTWDKQICYVGQLLHVNTCEYPVLGIMSGTGTREQPKRVRHRFLPTDRYKLSQSLSRSWFFFGFWTSRNHVSLDLWETCTLPAKPHTLYLHLAPAMQANMVPHSSCAFGSVWKFSISLSVEIKHG